MTQLPLWQPSLAHIKQSNLNRFMELTGQSSYQDLYHFSITHIEEFWSAVWDFCEIVALQKGNIIAKNLNSIKQAEFFPEARLNFSANLLRRRDDGIAIEFFGENTIRKQITFANLYAQVNQFIQLLKQWGVQPGDRVAGYLPNVPETIVAMLAATAIGAVWSSCSPDFGSQGVIDRFGQIAPKIFIAADGYFYNGKRFDCLEKIPAIVAEIPIVLEAG